MSSLALEQQVHLRLVVRPRACGAQNMHVMQGSHRYYKQEPHSRTELEVAGLLVEREPVHECLQRDAWHGVDAGKGSAAVPSDVHFAHACTPHRENASARPGSTSTYKT